MAQFRTFLSFHGLSLVWIFGLAFHAAAQEEFVGPFSSWANAKSTYGAAGDGSTDDTAALQNALSNIGNPGRPDVLYLPAGVYRITSTLNLGYRTSISIIGEDPSRTTILWAGPSGGTMMAVNGVTQSRWGRITWDGSGTAGIGVAHQWDRAGGYAPTNLEHADEVFRNMSKGIVGGRPGGENDAEVTIARVIFTNCSTAGISLESFNALDYWIWDSQFINNARGITNEFGAGNFSVYRSLFQGSTVADLTISNTQFFSIRGNTSIGSRQFFRASYVGQNAALVTIQGNRILDTANPVAIDIANVGPLVLLDNQIRSAPSAGGPAARISTVSPGGDLISVGNAYTVANPVAVQTPSSRWWTLDDQIVAYGAIDGTPPAMPGTLPNLGRTVIEVPAGARTSTIQAAINQAAQLTGQRPVVHLPKGTYPLNQTLTVPANSDLQIVGDGHNTNLVWGGAPGGTVFQLNGPSKATFRELFIFADTVNGIEIGNPDQPGSRVHLDGVFQEHARQNNILTEGLQYTAVNLQSYQMSHGSGSSLKAIGAGGGGTSRIALFGGTGQADTSSSAAMYEVTSGGRILAEDFWYEGPASRLVDLTGSGAFTLNGAHIAPQSSPLDPVIEVAGFQGAAVVLAVHFDLDNPSKRIQVTSENSGTQVLLAGLEGTIPNYFARLSSGGYLNFVDSKLYGSSGSMPTPDQGDPRTATFIRNMLTQLRTTLPSQPVNLASGVTDVRLYRVDIAFPNVGIHLKSSGQSAAAQVNQAPIVNPGGNQGITLPASATLSGHVTDDGLPNNTLIVAWSQVLGPAKAVIANVTSLNTTVSFPVAGTYVLQLTASDSALSSSAAVTITVAPAPPPPSSPPSSGGLPTLVASYGFNEGSGFTVSDASGNGNTGVLVNTTWSAAGKSGSALSFNGTNALVTINSTAILQLTAGMTLEAWVNPSVINSGWRDVIYKGDDNYGLMATSNQGVVVPAGVGTVGGANVVTYGTSPLPVNTWSHLALTFDGTTFRLYVNGVQVSSATQAGSLATSTNPLQIGGDSIYGQYFQGLIDEVRIYNGPLTAAQIQADMNTSIGGTVQNVNAPVASAKVQGLVAAYSFNEGQGSTVTDSSGNGNTGQLVNAVWTASGKFGGALTFNGSNARVVIANSPSISLSTGMTLEAWVLPSSTTSSWRDVIYKGNDSYFIEATSVGGGAPAAGGSFGNLNVTTSAGSKLPINTWTHLAATYDGATLRLYVNGTQVSSLACTGAIVTSSNPLEIGGDSIFGQFFSGTIDEVRVYDVPLNATQIAADMQTAIQ